MLPKTYIRWLIRTDMPAVLRIERASFGQPWTEDEFLRCLKQRNCIGLVAVRSDQAIGFVLYETLQDKLRVLNLAVDPGERRSGAGTALVRKLQDKLQRGRRERLILLVRERNLDAQLFFRAVGLRAVKVLRRYYRDEDEDAIGMRYALPARAAC